MEFPHDQPAKTYDLNMLASLLGRCNVLNSRPVQIDERQKISNALSAVLHLMRQPKPLAPHTDPHLLRILLKETGRLNIILKGLGVQQILTGTQKKEVSTLLRQMSSECQERLHKGAPRENLVSPDAIARMFEFPKMWAIGQKEADKNLITTQATKIHPPIPTELKKLVELDETCRLINLVREMIFNADSLNSVKTHLTQTAKDYHLFWTVIDSGLDYITPSNYTLADQFSFDIPHNVAHLSHLDTLKKCGALGYIDSMAHRAYFEAVAVFSEQQMTKWLIQNEKSGKIINDVLSENHRISPEALREWMIADRIYEARLRTARLLADAYTIEGMSFEEMASAVSKKVEISYEQSKSEVSKYYPWTGLGAMYTLGGLRLAKNGILNPMDAIRDHEGHPLTTWRSFSEHLEKSEPMIDRQ